MIELLESRKRKMVVLSQWIDVLDEYTDMNGISGLGFFYSDDLHELQKEKGVSSEEKNYITFLINHLNARQATSPHQSVFTLSRDIICKIFSTAQNESQNNTFMNNALTRMLRMSRDCFLNIERKKASLYQNFIDDLSETLDQTVADSQDSIGTFLILRHLHSNLEAPFGNRQQFRMAATRESVEKYKRVIHDSHLTNHLLDAENDISHFYPGFFKSNIASIELPRVLSLQPFTPKASFNQDTLRSDQPAPLEVNDVSVSNAEIHKIRKKYKEKFKEKRTKRNKVFTPALMDQILSLDYSQARTALIRLNEAYLLFEQEKRDLYHTYM